MYFMINIDVYQDSGKLYDNIITAHWTMLLVVLNHPIFNGGWLYEVFNSRAYVLTLL